MKIDKNKMKIAMARACLGLNDISLIANMPLSTVKKVVSGKSVKPVTLGKIAKALQVDVTELVNEENTNSKERV